MPTPKHNDPESRATKYRSALGAGKNRYAILSTIVPAGTPAATPARMRSVPAIMIPIAVTIPIATVVPANRDDWPAYDDVWMVVPPRSPTAVPARMGCVPFTTPPVTVSIPVPAAVPTHNDLAMKPHYRGQVTAHGQRRCRHRFARGKAQPSHDANQREIT
jgi:hypothetical protein